MKSMLDLGFELLTRHMSELSSTFCILNHYTIGTIMIDG